MSKEEYIIVYSRVSSAAQSLKMQISLAKQYLARENIESSEVQFILARNFYEYSELAKLFINYNVEVIFTASDEAPFSNNLALESFYDIFGQMEGNSIKSRTDD